VILERLARRAAPTGNKVLENIVTSELKAEKYFSEYTPKVFFQPHNLQERLHLYKQAFKILYNLDLVNYGRNLLLVISSRYPNCYKR
jgi:hypothetical protein